MSISINLRHGNMDLEGKTLGAVELAIKAIVKAIAETRIVITTEQGYKINHPNNNMCTLTANGVEYRGDAHLEEFATIIRGALAKVEWPEGCSNLVTFSGFDYTQPRQIENANDAEDVDDVLNRTSSSNASSHGSASSSPTRTKRMRV